MSEPAPPVFAVVPSEEALDAFGEPSWENASWIGLCWYSAVLRFAGDRSDYDMVVLDPQVWQDIDTLRAEVGELSCASGVEYEEHKGNAVAYMKLFAVPPEAPTPAESEDLKVAQGGPVPGSRWLTLVHTTHGWRVWGYGDRLPADRIVL